MLTAVPPTLTLCTPAHRCLVVVVHAERGDEGDWVEDAFEVQIYPVIAIIAAAQAHSEGPMFDTLISDEEDGLVEASFEFGHLANGAYRVVSAPWPPMLDDERLKPTIARLRNEARHKVEYEERKSTPGPQQEGAVSNG